MKIWDSVYICQRWGFPFLLFTWYLINFSFEENQIQSLSQLKVQSASEERFFCLLEPVVPEEPCDPDPCGPNSQKREMNGACVCSCLPNFSGSPPNCRPECIISSECSLTTACVSQKCVDPCPGVCGSNARCQVVNHNPICQCPQGYVGDPFVRCDLRRKS